MNNAEARIIVDQQLASILSENEKAYSFDLAHTDWHRLMIWVYFSGMLNRLMRQGIRKLLPVFVVLVGMLFILRDLGLGIPYVSPAPVTDLVSAEASCH